MIQMIFTKILKNTIQIKKWKILIVLDDIIADMLSKDKRNPIVTDLFIRGRNLNISLVFITQFYFALPKNNTKFNSLFCYENSKQKRNCI